MSGRKSERARALLKAAAQHYGLSVFEFVSRQNDLDWQAHITAISAIADQEAAL